MTRLNDTQRILLASALQRDSRSFYPLPDTVTGDDKHKVKVVDALVKRGLAEVRETCDKPATYRTREGVGFGVFLTEAGRAAIEGGPIVTQVVKIASEPKSEARPRKSSMVLALLRRDGGATLAELIDATGWLPHSTRAALTGLRKKGYAIERSRLGADTCYRVAA